VKLLTWTLAEIVASHGPVNVQLVFFYYGGESLVNDYSLRLNTIWDCFHEFPMRNPDMRPDQIQITWHVLVDWKELHYVWIYWTEIGLPSLHFRMKLGDPSTTTMVPRRDTWA